MTVADKKTDIRTLSRRAIEDYLTSVGERKFRAKQIEYWLWKKGVGSFSQMRNIPQPLRIRLEENYCIKHFSVSQRQDASDGTTKLAFQLNDGLVVEGVLIPSRSRLTACISSQAGCNMGCAFCATARMKRLRDLDSAEIFDQIATIARLAETERGKGLSNIVYMGMGEPLLNYRNVLDSIDRITNPDWMGISPRRITVSTVGIAKMIKKLGDDKVKFNLAISLHAANDIKRSEIIPVNKQNSLEELKDSLRYFYEKTGTRVTYEYIIFDGFNDTLDDAAELARFCKHQPCKVNIIEYNPIENGRYRQASDEKVAAFVSLLDSKNIIANIRRSRGKEINAACGQLAGKIPRP